MHDHEFLEAFEGCRLAIDDFNHQSHLRVAWLYLQDMPLPEAMARLRDGLRRFTAHVGAAHHYHETVTFTYAMAIHERMSGERSFRDFLAAHPDLSEPWQAFMTRYYHKTTLDSPQARASFVLPDRIA